jgi:hypothetical protein
MMKKLLTLLLLFLCISASAQVPAYVPTNGLVGWWPFNGNANDESGNGNNGTVNGAILTTDRFGNANNAYSFSNSNYIVVPENNIFETNSHTISFWINPNSYPQLRYDILGKDGCSSQDRQYVVQYESNGVIRNAIFTNQEFTFNSTSSVQTNNWTNITISWDGIKSKTFINGICNDSLSTNGTLANGTMNLYFGGNPCFNQIFNGKIDDIAFYNRTLTQQEITNLYTQTTPVSCLPSYVPTTGLVGYWPFCGNANDESGNGNNGTVNGATLTTDRFGNANKAYSFDGVNDYVRVLGNSNLNLGASFSISTWVKTSTIPTSNNNYILVSKRDDNGICCSNNSPYFLSLIHI